MARQTALVIDDESQIRRAVSHALAEDFAKVVEAATGVEGLHLAALEKPSLVVLDLGLPDMTGVAVCAEIRKTSDAMILVLSARHADQEKVTLLDAGADDYVTKPFSTLELKARVRALLRRASSHGDNRRHRREDSSFRAAAACVAWWRRGDQPRSGRREVRTQRPDVTDANACSSTSRPSVSRSGGITSGGRNRSTLP